MSTKSALVKKVDGPLGTFASMIESRGEIPIGPFIFTRTGVVFQGEPTFEEMQAAHAYVDFNLAGAPFWKGDLLAYGEARADFKERLSQLAELTGTAEKTLLNIKSVAEQVPPSRRRADVSFGVHAAVAPLSPREQTTILELAATEGLGVREVRTLIRTKRRASVIEGQAELKGMYRVIYADPPWSYEDRGQVTPGSAYKRAEAEYPCMTIQEICDLPVRSHVLPNAVLLMWVTAPMILQNPGPREVIEAWGFEYKQKWVWNKVFGNFGHYGHGTHEDLVICTRGDGLPDVDANWLDNVQTIRRSGTHSEKPELFRQHIEKLWTRGPYLELFGRKKTKGWDVFGNDARLWSGASKGAQ